MHGQGKKLIEGIRKGLMFKHHYPGATKLGKPTGLYVQVKSVNSEWIKTIKKANYLTDDIIINRDLNQIKLILERKVPNFVLLDDPVQKIVWTGSETDLSTSFTIIQDLPPGMTGFRVEEIWRKEGDSIPLARNFLDIEVEPKQEDVYKADNTTLTQVESANVETMKRGPGRSQEFMFKDSTHYFNSQKDFCDFLEEHKKKSNTNIEYIINTSYNNFVNQAFISFLNRWIHDGTVKFFSAPACARFLYKYDLKKESEINTYINWFRNAYYERVKFYKGNNTDDEVEKWFSEHPQNSDQ